MAFPGETRLREDLAGAERHESMSAMIKIVDMKAALNEIERLTKYVEAFRREEVRADALATKLDDAQDEIARLRAALDRANDDRDMATAKAFAAKAEAGRLLAALRAECDQWVAALARRGLGTFGFQVVAGIDRADAKTVEHASDCAIHSGPALPPGQCDCGADAAAPTTKPEWIAAAGAFLNACYGYPPGSAAETAAGIFAEHVESADGDEAAVLRGVNPKTAAFEAATEEF
jgi:hypothetical protein